MADVKWSQFPSVIPSNSDEVVGLKSGGNVLFSIANIVAAVRNGLENIFVPLTRTINSKALSTDISLDSSDIDYDNTGSGLTADNVQDALDELAQGGGGGSAADITYDPTTSGASATNVQDALDEAFGDLDDKQASITASGILKGDGQGGVSAAVAGTDYQAPLTAGTDYATPAQLADKANPGQIGYPETGTTASRNYTAGEYICWNGVTYTADTNIALGATLSASGGNKNLTECVGGGFNSLFAALDGGRFYVMLIDVSGKTLNTAYQVDLPAGFLTSNTSIAWVNYRVWGNSYSMLSVALDSNIQTNVLLVSTNKLQYTCVGSLSNRGVLEVALYHKA